MYLLLIRQNDLVTENGKLCHLNTNYAILKTAGWWYRLWEGTVDNRSTLVVSIYDASGAEVYWYELAEQHRVMFLPTGAVKLDKITENRTKTAQIVQQVLSKIALRQHHALHGELSVQPGIDLYTQDFPRASGYQYFTDGEWQAVADVSRTMRADGATFVLQLTRQTGVVTGFSLVMSSHCVPETLGSTLKSII